MTRLGFLILVVLFLSPWTFAQHNCPEGLRYVGVLSGTGSTSDGFDKRVTLRLPANATLDESFQQKNVRASNGKSGVTSTLRAEDVPKGLLIITYGKSDEVYEQGWAVSDPELKIIEQDASGKVMRYQFGMKLVCKVGITGANPNFGECSVNAEVCYKPAK